jgi:hypothetical protein
VSLSLHAFSHAAAPRTALSPQAAAAEAATTAASLPPADVSDVTNPPAMAPPDLRLRARCSVQVSPCRTLDPASNLYTLPVGDGLFAEQLIPCGDAIAEFTGQVIAATLLPSREAEGHGGYAVALSHGWVLDCFESRRRGECLASAANSPARLWDNLRGKKAMANASLVVSKGTQGLRVYLRATRRIRPGQEVLVSYQSGYRFPTPVDQPPPPLSRSPPASDVCSAPALAAATQRQAAVAAHRARERVSALPILSLTAADEALLDLTLRTTNLCLRSIFHEPPLELPHIREFLEEAHRVAADSYGIAAAQAYGAGFSFPDESILRDHVELRNCGWSLELFAAMRHQRLADSRLSLQRIDIVFGPLGELVPSLRAEDLARLRDLAGGIQVLLPDGFTPVAAAPPLRARYCAVAGAVHRLLYKQILAGTLAVLPLEDVMRSLAVHDLHLNNSQHWIPKKGKASGRAIADVSNTEDPLGPPPLNGHPGPSRDAVTAAYTALYGAVSHPTLASLMLMVIEQADRWGWSRLQLWKKDLAGAFNLLWFRPAHVRFLLFRLTDDMVAVHLAGLFGLGGLPPAFAVITRAIVAKLRTLIVGACDMYVDDTMGVGPADHLLADLTAADETMTALLGPQAVAVDKNEQGRRLEWLGWDVCLDTQTVTLSARNLLKMVHVFFSFDLSSRVSQVHVLRMASLASRLAPLCPFLGLFTRALHADASRYPAGTSSAALRHLSNDARSDVAFWRALIMIFRFRPTVLARPIESFRPRGATFAIEYDASLSAIAAGVSMLDTSGGPPALLGYVVFTIPFAFDADSSYQNTSEYLAVLAGFLCARRLGLSHSSAVLHGDSVSSLHWAAEGRAGSTLARRANIGMALFTLHTGLSTHSTVHVPGVQNVVYDGLSRGKTPAEVGLDPALQFVFEPASAEASFLLLCDPLRPLRTELDHFALAAAFQDLLLTD